LTTETRTSQAAAPASQADNGTVAAPREEESILAALDEGADSTEQAAPQADEGTDAPEPDGTDSADADDSEELDLESLLKTEVREAIAARAREEALKEHEEKQAAEAKEREKTQTDSTRREGYKQSFQGRAPAIRAWAEEQGLPREETDKLVNTFNLHHRDAIEVASWELTDKLVETFRNRLPESERESFTYDGTNDDLNAFISDYDSRITKEARKGYLSEAEVKQRVADEKVAMLVKLREKPELLNARSGPRRTGGGGATPSNVTYAQLQKMSKAEIEALPKEVFDAAINEGTG
jgi:hypothetical protein